MTQFYTTVFQPPDLTVNKFAKDFMKGMFSTCFSRQISLGLENGVELDDIEVDYRFSVPNHCMQNRSLNYIITCSPMRGKILLPMVGRKRASSTLSNLVQAVFHLWIHSQIYVFWSNLSSYVKTWVYRPSFQKSLIVFVRKSRKARMTPTQNGDLIVILMIAQNQNQIWWKRVWYTRWWLVISD